MVHRFCYAGLVRMAGYAYLPFHTCTAFGARCRWRKSAAQCIRWSTHWSWDSQTKQMKVRGAIALDNADDCLSTKSLRDWLERERDALNGQASPYPPAASDGAPPETVNERQRKRAALKERLKKRPFGRSRSPKRRGCCALVVGEPPRLHRRESKADWWEYFRLKGLTARTTGHWVGHDEDLLDERSAVSGLVFVERLREGEISTDRYSFEKQETDIRQGDTVCERGEKDGITATSHKVIQNLLLEVIKAAREAGLQDFKCTQKVNERPDVTSPGITLTTDNAEALAALRGGAHVVGATAWLWFREEYFEAVEVLFADEAGQMSLANVLAVSQAAKNVVCLATLSNWSNRSRAAIPMVPLFRLISGSASTGGHLLSDDLLARGCAARNGICDRLSDVPVLREPASHQHGCDGLPKMRARENISRWSWTWRALVSSGWGKVAGERLCVSSGAASSSAELGSKR